MENGRSPERAAKSARSLVQRVIARGGLFNPKHTAHRTQLDGFAKTDDTPPEMIFCGDVPAVRQCIYAPPRRWILKHKMRRIQIAMRTLKIRNPEF